MLANLQKKTISETILKPFYKKGIIPAYSDFVAILQKKFRWKEFGKPFFTPRGAARNLKVDPVALKDNVTEIRDDLDLLFQDTNTIKAQEIVIETGLYGEVANLKQKLVELGEEIDAKLLSQYGGGSELFFDNFRNTDKVDLSRTDCYVDTEVGYVTLPADASSSVRLSSDKMKLVSEAYSTGYASVSNSFLSIFTDYINENWQASLPAGGYYQAVVNLTGGEVVAGTGNEADINKIAVDPITSLTINIEYSTDGVNWSTLGSKQISSLTIFEFEPTWVLYLRFTISGNTKVGLRRVEIGKIGTTGTADLVSKELTSTSALYSFDFQTTQNTPYGTAINHYLSTSPDGPWQSISPGSINLSDVAYTTITFGASADFSYINYMYAANILQQQPVVQSGKLQRGYSQFKVESFGFNWDSQADPNHVPDISDWATPKSQVLSCYMGSEYSGTDTSPVPNLLASGKTSFVYQYSNSQQDFWAVSLIASGFGAVLKPNYNYKITTYLYSDRDVLLSNSAGGLYAIGGAAGATLSNSAGWSLYINSNRIAYDNKVYCSASSPGSGTLLPTQGKSFPVSIQAGWNKIELLIYMPSLSNFNNSLVSTGKETPLVLLLRPNVCNFTLPSDAYSSTAPQIRSYPIWADGTLLKRVSEFYLQWNVPPWNKDYWSWQTEDVSGTVTGLLLNYLPPSKSYTIDGNFTGSVPNFLLTYTYAGNPTKTIYYKANLVRNPIATLAPKLYSYKFLVMR